MTFGACPFRSRLRCTLPDGRPLRFRPPLSEAGFVRHLRSDHGWAAGRAWQFVNAHRQTLAPRWMQVAA